MSRTELALHHLPPQTRPGRSPTNLPACLALALPPVHAPSSPPSFFPPPTPSANGTAPYLPTCPGTANVSQRTPNALTAPTAPRKPTSLAWISGPPAVLPEKGKCCPVVCRRQNMKQKRQQSTDGPWTVHMDRQTLWCLSPSLQVSFQLKSGKPLYLSFR